MMTPREAELTEQLRQAHLKIALLEQKTAGEKSQPPQRSLTAGRPTPKDYHQAGAENVLHGCHNTCRWSNRSLIPMW
jgi:hypothetical protein